MRSTRPSSSARPVGGAATGIATKALYGVIAILFLYGYSVAARRMLFDPPRPAEEHVAQSSPQPAGQATRAAQPPTVEDDPPVELSGSAPWPARGYRPAIRQNSDAAPTAGESASVPSSVRDQRPAAGWSTALSTLVDRLPFVGGGGAAGTPATTTSPGSASPSAAASARSNQGPVREVFFGTTEGSACQPGERQFGLTDISDLYVCVVWAGLSGKYVEKISFVLPDGNVYQTMNVPFLTADAPANIDPMVEIDGQQVQAKRAGWGANGEAMVTVVLPVAGTFITQYSMGGLWTVRVALNGQTVGQDNFDLLQP